MKGRLKFGDAENSAPFPSVIAIYRPPRAAEADPLATITVPELAALLRVSLPTAYGAIRRGQVPGAVKVGRGLRLHRATVLRWLEQGCVSRHGEKP